MRRKTKISMTGWIGLAALGALQYMGPRPLFVKTAYAGPVETVKMTCQAEAGAADPAAAAVLTAEPLND